MGLEEQFLQQFDVIEEEDRSNRWDKWVSRFECYLSIKNIKEDKVKIEYLRFFGGTGIDKIYKTLQENTDTYERAKVKLTIHFTSQFNPKVFVLKFRDI